MARADRRRAGRPSTAARARSEYAVIEETLFFNRLRRQAKWAFIFLALVFAVGFVVFGVGSGGGVGLGDILQGGSASGAPSVDDAREKLRKNPSDAPALLELSSALQTEGRADEAIRPLVRYTQIRKRDEDALRQLASLYVGKATQLRNQAAQAQAEGQIVASPTDFLPPSTTPLGQALADQPFNRDIQDRAQKKLVDRYTKMQAAYRQAQGVYVRLAKLSPQDPSLQLQLADVAVNSGDTGAALKAYRRFLKLAPDDPSAPLVKQEIKRLQQESAAAGG
jgi:tetratricopeptide (TPR) repeat protein